MKIDSLFETVKQEVSLPEMAELYGLEVKPNGMTVCPFHDDETPSMKLNKDYYYCFGCGATGDAIDLAAHLFDLPLRQAAEKIAVDFGLSHDSQAPMPLPRRTAIDREINRQREWYTARLLSRYFRLLSEWEVQYTPKQPEDEFHPRFMEAMQQKDYVEYLLDMLTYGTPAEKAAICSERNPDVRRIAHRLHELDHQKSQAELER